MDRPLNVAPGPYAETVRRSWARALPLIEQALEHAGGTHTVADVLQGICEGRLQLWLGERCMAVSEILSFPRRRVLNMFLAAGDARELKALEPGIAAYARSQACELVMASARLTKASRPARRAGWLRFWPGYVPSHLVCRKELA